ncbi:MAG TPA: beta-phosphoglucomutase [Noviherbaspirillum sp.]
MGKSAYQAVIFDLDGVITDTAHYHYLAWRKLAMSLDAPFDAVFNEQLKGIDRMGSLEHILARTAKKYSSEEKLTLADRKNSDYQDLIRNMTPNDLLPGAQAALKSVREAGLKVGLASVSKNAFAVLDRLGISGEFDYVVDAAKISRSKPDPEIFLTAAKNLGVLPSACIGVEDSVAGLQSIKSSGMYAIGIGDPSILTQADRVIPGLDQFNLSEYLIGQA